MISGLVKFGEASNTGGISSLGLNLGGFLSQLATFVLVLLILRKWVFPKVVETLEKRRSTLEQSLVQAKKTEETLQNAETKAVEILHKARQQADAALRDAKKQADEFIAKAETSAGTKAQRIIDEALSQLEIERQKLRRELRVELTELVALATERVIEEKLDEREDMRLIDRKIKELQI